MSGYHQQGNTNAALMWNSPPQQPQMTQPVQTTPWRIGDVVPVEDVPTDKTYISLLTECCTKRGVTPIFECTQTEGQSHDPLYGYKATADKYQATAQGKSKKTAKHLAAKKVLEQIVASGEHIQWALPGRTEQEAADYVSKLMADILPVKSHDDVTAVLGAGGESEPSTGVTNLNVVGEVNKICQRRKWPQPVFNVIEERTASANPNDKLFVIECSVGSNYIQTGEGRNKKVAKRIAAEKMLAQLKTIPEDGSVCNEDAVVEREICRALRRLAIRPMITQDRQRLEAFFGPLRATPGTIYGDLRRGVLELEPTVAVKPPNYRRILHKLAKEHKFTVEYLPVQARPDGQLQCLCQIQVAPVAVTCGHGPTADAAEQSAAHSMLHYLKIIFQPPASIPVAAESTA